MAVDLKKFGLSFFQIEPWLKNIRFIVGAIIIGFIALTIWRAYFRKDVQQTQHADITVQPGGTLNYTPTQKVEAQKSKWWIPCLFGEIYGFAEYDTRQRSRVGVGTRAGLRWEF